MNYKLSVNSIEPQEWQRADEFMEIGDVAQLESGDLLLRMYNNAFVNLNRPSSTYSGGCGLKVRSLQSGTKIQLTIR